MDPPRNVSEVRPLLSMSQYSARFIPNFAEMTTPLRDLTHQGAKWRWSQTEQAAFEKLKDTLSSETVLGYYETGQDTKLLVDAGPNGLGLVLMQKKPQGWKAVECASRNLTEVEKRYSQIDREALAIRWACERCYKYLIRSSFVERKIASCIPCQASTNSSQREPLKMSPTPKGPWLQVSADFCGPFLTGESVLVVLDAYSKYPEVEIVCSIAAKNTIPALERIFATHGIPEVLKTDNGPPFQGHAFQSFAKEKGFTQRKITPLWPEANGHVEGFMKNLGKVARTAHSQGKDWRRELYVILANYRATPHPSTGKSPYQLCTNRTVRIKLPTIMETTPDTEAMQKDKDSKAKMKAYADQKRQVKPHNLNAADITLVKQSRLNKASPHFEPVPYTVLDVKGPMFTARRATDQKEVTRNTSHFKKLPNPPGRSIPDT